MSLAIYSTDFDPEQLYFDGELDRHTNQRIEQFVRAGDRPPDMCVDLETRTILWRFDGRRTTASTREGRFVAAYCAGEDDDLFRGFERALRTLHDSADWALPYGNDPRTDAGFNLWRVDARYSGLRETEVTALHETVKRPTHEQVVFGTSDYQSALAVIRALERDGVSCTVCIGDPIPDADLVLQPGGADFEPRTPAAQAILDDDRAVGRTDWTPTTEEYDRPSVGSRIAGAILLVVLSLSAYSFFSLAPVHPITGLAAVGGLLGTILGYTVLQPGSTRSFEGFVSALRRGFLTDLSRSVIVLAYGTGLAFLFPTLFRVSGEIVTGTNWLFGSIATPQAAFAYIVLFVPAVFVASYLIARKYPAVFGDASGDGTRRLLLAHAVYAIALFVLTGFGQGFWYVLVPSA